MNVTLLTNPRSGRARSAGRVAELLAALQLSGHVVQHASPGEPLEPKLLNAGALIVAGGDGSVHHAAPIAARLDVPLLHYPLGTENLFAREFASLARPEDCLATLHAGRSRRIDMAVVNGRAFVVMLSAGVDASVVHRVAAARVGGISRLDYARRIASVLPRHIPPRFTVVADGTGLATNERGMLIVANCRQYAARLDPAFEADMSDGLLDVVFIPAGGVTTLALAAAAMALRIDLREIGARMFRASNIHIRSHDPADVQLDGEAVAFDAELSIAVQPRVLRVLVSW